MALTYRVRVEGMTGAERGEFDEMLTAELAPATRPMDG